MCVYCVSVLLCCSYYIYSLDESAGIQEGSETESEYPDEY